MSQPTGAQSTFGERSAEELAAAAAAGSSASFEALVDRLGPRLLRYLHQKVHDPHAAEDLLQETFLRAYRNLDRFDPSRSLAAWMFTIATRLAAGYWRSFRPRAAMDDVDLPDRCGGDPLEAASRREEQADLWARAQRALPESQFTALWLRYAEEMSIREIAAVMGRSVASVKVLLHRACRGMTRFQALGARPAARPATGEGTGRCAVESR